MGRASKLLAALKSRPIAGVTCCGKRDGGGAQIQAIMSAQLFARVARIRYFHTPLQSVSHAPGDPGAWASKWENAFGLGQGCEPVPEDTPIVHIDTFLSSYRGPMPIVEAPHFHDFVGRRPDLYAPLLDEFRTRCRLVGTPSAHAAVHIRRGDVALPGSKFTDRLTPIETVARTVSIIRKTRPDLPIHIYSQGQLEDFSELPIDCILHLDTDVFVTLAALINADVLVTAKSSFSYVAALLSRGVVLYEPYKHRPLSSWIILSSDGGFELPDAVPRIRFAQR